MVPIEEVVVVELLAVVRRDHHHRVFEPLQAAQCVQDASQLPIRIGHLGVVESANRRQQLVDVRLGATALQPAEHLQRAQLLGQIGASASLEGSVRIEEVHPGEEGLPFAEALEPFDRARSRVGAVALEQPAAVWRFEVLVVVLEAPGKPVAAGDDAAADEGRCAKAALAEVLRHGSPVLGNRAGAVHHIVLHRVGGGVDRGKGGPGRGRLGQGALEDHPLARQAVDVGRVTPVPP